MIFFWYFLSYLQIVLNLILAHLLFAISWLSIQIVRIDLHLLYISI